MSEPTLDTHRPTEPENAMLVPTCDTGTPETRPGDSEIPATPPFESSASDIPGRYVDLVPHAKGGLGEVYRGRDAELNRPVAVKRIQPRHADNADSRARFLLEAEVTARLEHPGVVPVYGLVDGPDGQPCYAMRFIQGESLSEAIAGYHATQPAASASERDRSPARLRSRLVTERSLSFRQLLTRFIALCNTVAYAHSRGIIHRDLKPHNVMLGNYGETLLVDWGLARPVGRTEEQRTMSEESTLMPTAESGSATRTGQAVGTPAFMSPEQAAGNWAAVGPASDVYSLGATLYVLLTGQAPFKGGWAEMQRKIQRGDFPSPRQLCGAAVPAALSAVCLKAMAVRPAERYADAQALAADVEQWLADEPVSAYPEPIWIRARRWARKHPGRIAAMAAAVLVGLVSLGISSVIIGGKNRELESANTNLDDANAGLRATNWKLDLANARLHSIIADLKSKTDFLEEARQEYAAAHEILKRLADTDPSDAEAQRNLSISHENLGDVLRRQGELGQALAEYQEALTISERLAKADPKDARAQTDVFGSYFKVGLLHKAELQYAMAARFFRKGRLVLLPWHEKQMLSAQFKNAVMIVDFEIEFCERAEKALADLDFVLKQPPPVIPSLLEVRVRYFVKKNDPPALVATSEACAKLAEMDNKHTYNAACAWSLASGLAKDDAKLREEYAAKALALLKKTPTGNGHFVDSPAKLAAHMKKDKDLDPLREREDFKKLLAELEKDGR